MPDDRISHVVVTNLKTLESIELLPTAHAHAKPPPPSTRPVRIH